MTLTELPNDIDTLKRLVLDTHRQVVDRDERIAERDERLAEQEEELKSLQSQLAYLKHKLFGRRSEKIDPAQLLLFKELQARVDELQEKVEQEEITYRRRKGHGRRPLPDDLPAEDVVYPPESTDCPCCGEPMHPIGSEVTEELDYRMRSVNCIWFWRGQMWHDALRGGGSCQSASVTGGGRWPSSNRAG